LVRSCLAPLASTAGAADSDTDSVSSMSVSVDVHVCVCVVLGSNWAAWLVWHTTFRTTTQRSDSSQPWHGQY